MLLFLASPPQQSNREAAARGALREHRLAAEPRPEIRSQPAPLQGKGGKKAKEKKKRKRPALSQSRKQGRP